VLVGWLLQLRILGFGLLQDGEVGVGVFPEREEVFVGDGRPLDFRENPTASGGGGIPGLENRETWGTLPHFWISGAIAAWA
jgi:hypothetical protein